MGKDNKNAKEEEKSLKILKATDAEAYLAMQYRFVELPSGAVFKIKRISRNTALQFLSQSKTNTGDNIKDFEDFLKSCDPLFQDAIVEPKIGEKVTIQDIPFMDQMALSSAIVRFSGLSAEDLEKATSFR